MCKLLKKSYMLSSVYVFSEMGKDLPSFYICQLCSSRLIQQRAEVTWLLLPLATGSREYLGCLALVATESRG